MWGCKLMHFFYRCQWAFRCHSQCQWVQEGEAHPITTLTIPSSSSSPLLAMEVVLLGQEQGTQDHHLRSSTPQPHLAQHQSHLHSKVYHSPHRPLQTLVLNSLNTCRLEIRVISRQLPRNCSILLIQLQHSTWTSFKTIEISFCLKCAAKLKMAIPLLVYVWFIVDSKNTPFWDVTSCNMVKDHWHSSEMSVNLYWATWHYIPEDSTFRIPAVRISNPISYTFVYEEDTHCVTSCWSLLYTQQFPSQVCAVHSFFFF